MMYQVGDSGRACSGDGTECLVNSWDEEERTHTKKRKGYGEAKHKIVCMFMCGVTLIWQSEKTMHCAHAKDSRGMRPESHRCHRVDIIETKGTSRC